MRDKRKQPVTAQLVFPGERPIVMEAIAGVNAGNLIIKLSQELRRILIGYNVDGGAEITFKIEPAEKDELARPDPE